MQPRLCFECPGEYFGSLNKQIDGGLGLRLSEEDLSRLENRSYKGGQFPSINPAQSFTNLVPQFMLFECKRPHSAKDPLIQLAIRLAAEFTLRWQQGRNIDMPVLAVEIVGDEWKLWEAYHVKLPKERPTMGFGIKFVGPLEMGNTLGH